MLILSPPPPFLLFYLGYVKYLIKLECFLSCCTRIPYMTTSLSNCPIVFYMRACKCQLFTDESNHRLPKRLNYCFGVLASTTNRSIWFYLAYEAIIHCIVRPIKCMIYCHLSNLCSTASKFHPVLTLLQHSVEASSSKSSSNIAPDVSHHHLAATE